MADGPGGRRRHVLVAPDSFKGTFPAAEVAHAAAAGVAAAGGTATLCPLADGGEGTVAVLGAVLGAARHPVVVTGSLGRPVEGEFRLSSDGRTALVEAASANGLDLIDAADRDAERADTYGTGQLLAAAASSGARRILLGVGGSATTDGGRGAIRALRAAGGLRGVQLTVLCDVTNTFTDAATVFAAQKGADPDTVARLRHRLDDCARTWAQTLGRDPRGTPRTGCAGGLSGGLWAEYGAELVSGIDTVLDLVGFDALLAAADVVLTGEGRLDAQTGQGKVVSGVIRAAARAGVPGYAVVGQTRLTDPQARALGLAGVYVAPTRAAIRLAGGQVATGP